MRPPRQLITGKIPWLYLVVGLVAVVIQFNPDWRAALVYNRNDIALGQFWRIWTGHLVHFGWPHFIADGGLFIIMGWLLAERHACFSHLALFLMPLFVSAALFFLDASMNRYAGLSAVNLGLLLYLAAQGWQRNWTDWFWPAVLLIYVGEVIFETLQGGHGGGMIRFDDSSIQVATGAHLASAAYALLAVVVAWFTARRRSQAAAAS